MDLRDNIQNVLDFIDKNIKENIEAEQLSKIACFSTPHFYRLFKLHVGCSPIEYVLKRRLYFAAKELICSQYRIIDIAFEYCFESHDVFTRAFKRVYGMTPEFYRRNGNCLPEFNIILSNKEYEENNNMHYVEIVTFPQTYLIGVENKLHVDEWAPDVFDRMYESVFKNAPNLVHSPVESSERPYTCATHILSILNPDGSYNYFAGVEVSDFSDVPKVSGVITRIIPEMMCAMIGYENGLDFQEIAGYLYGEWLENNDFIASQNEQTPYCPIEWYSPDGFDIYEERIYMPIKPFIYDIKKVENYNGIYYREISDDRHKVKDPAFDTMLKWANDNNLFNGKEPVKFEVRYGELPDKKFFCEVFYQTDKNISEYKNNYPVETKTYSGGLYAVASVLHHSLEQYGRSFARILNKNEKYDAKKDDAIGGWYEEYILNTDKLDYFTKINLYAGIKRK